MADTKDIRRMIATATIGDGDQVLNILEKICDRLDVAATAAPVEQSSRVSGEQWLAQRGFADSRTYSSVEIEALLEEFAASKQ